MAKASSKFVFTNVQLIAEKPCTVAVWINIVGANSHFITIISSQYRLHHGKCGIIIMAMQCMEFVVFPEV